MFLDIACFMLGKEVGMEVALYGPVWGKNWSFRLNVLERKALVSRIKMYGHCVFEMHDQLRDLGRSMGCNSHVRLVDDSQRHILEASHVRLLLEIF